MSVSQTLESPPQILEETPPKENKVDRRRRGSLNEKKMRDPAFWDVQKLKAYIEENDLHDKLPEVGRGTHGKLVKPDYLFVVRNHRKEHFPRKRTRHEISEEPSFPELGS